jgi:serine/threonine protein kinase
MIAFSCPHCGAQLQAKENAAGKTRPCPNCSRVVQTPAAGFSSLPGLGGAADEKGDSRTAAQPTLHTPAAAVETAPAVASKAPPREFPFLAPPKAADELGRLGAYLVRKVLGTGSMGMVFLAEDGLLKRPVALKVMKPSLAAFPEYHKRFLREAQLAAAIDHEHIVTIYQVGEDRGVPYLAMKLLQGETLEDRLERKDGGLPLAEVLRVGREIAEGLAAAHARGLIHRDIKPANIWLEEGKDRVKIVDFGLARDTGDAGFTQAGAVIGTPSYMSPEQANAEEVDARCDLFSLGAVLYRASTGELPFPGKDTLSVLAALATKTPPSPNRLDTALPRPFSDLVMRLLAKARVDRPQTAREVVEALEALERAATAPPAPAAADGSSTRVRSEQPAGGRAREKEASSSAVRSKGPRASHYPSPPRRRAKKEKEWPRAVLVAGLVLLVVASVVLLLGLLRYTGWGESSSDTGPGGNVVRPAPQQPQQGARRLD